MIILLRVAKLNGRFLIECAWKIPDGMIVDQQGGFRPGTKC